MKLTSLKSDSKIKSEPETKSPKLGHKMVDWSLKSIMSFKYASLFQKYKWSSLSLFPWDVNKMPLATQPATYVF